MTDSEFPHPRADVDKELNEILDDFRRVVWNSGWNSPSDKALEEAKSKLLALIQRENRRAEARGHAAQFAKDSEEIDLESRLDELNRLKVQFTKVHWERLRAETNSWAKYVDRRIARLRALEENKS